MMIMHNEIYQRTNWLKYIRNQGRICRTFQETVYRSQPYSVLNRLKRYQTNSNSNIAVSLPLNIAKT